MECIQCKKPCKALRVKNPLDGNMYMVKDICKDCIFDLGDVLGGEDPSDATYSCSKCLKKAYVLVKGECRKCYTEGKTVIKTLPDSVEELPPPLGYCLIGCDDVSAKQEVDLAYLLTSDKELAN